MNWLILRGLVSEKRHWGLFPDQLEAELQKKYQHAKVFSIDLPGFGTEVHRNSPYSIAEIVKDIRERWLKECAVSNQAEWHILANSLGGMVALSWAEQFPHDFKKMVLINSSVKKLNPVHHRMRPTNYLKLLQIMLAKNYFEREKYRLQITTNLKGQALLERAKVHVSYIETHAPRRKNAVAQMIAGFRFKPPKNIEIPKLVLSSLGDTLVDPACSRAIAKYYRADHVEHPHANHDLSIDDSQWIIEQVNKWL